MPNPFPKTPILCAATLAAALATSPVAAQTAFDLEELVFSPTRIATPRESVGASISVVTREDLEAAGDVELGRFLARLPGVTVTQTGPIGALTNIRIRGAAPRYAAVFIDGIRIDDPTGIATETDFGPLTTADIGRIEVLRGSQSALWGGSAVGGVINITTIEAIEDGLTQSAALEAGSYRTVSGRYGLTLRNDRTSFAFNLSRLVSDGFSAADENDGNTEPDGIRSTRASLTLRHAATDTVTLGFSAFVQRTWAQYDGFPPPDFVLADADNVQRRRDSAARVFAEFALGDSTQEIGLATYRITRRNIEEFSDTTFRGDRLRLDWVGSSPVTPELTLVYGADISRERARIPEQRARELTVGGAFLQGLWAPRPDLDLSITGRIDRNSDFGNFRSGRLSAAWRPAPGLTLRGALSRGFLAPSIYQQFGDARFAIAPNPDLTPETSRSAELGVDYAFATGATLSATLFRLDTRNEIDFVSGAPSFYDNVPGTSKRTGLELEASVPLGEDVTLSGNYTYIDARRRDGERIPRVPRHDFALALDAKLGERLHSRTIVNGLAGRPDDGFPARRMPSFAVVNTAFRYELTDRADLTLRIDNLFDRQYQLVPGYGTSDRAFYVGVAGRF